MIKISHLSLGVSDLRASGAFYRDALGLQVEDLGGDLAVNWPDFLLTLHENPPAGRGKFHFGFKVGQRSEVDAWAERLRGKGAQIVAGPAAREGTYHLFVLDPDAYEIEIYAD